MKDNNEQLSAAKAEWLQTLDYDCRVNTINYWALRDQLRFGRLEGLAAKLYGFIKCGAGKSLGFSLPMASNEPSRRSLPLWIGVVLTFRMVV